MKGFLIKGLLFCVITALLVASGFLFSIRYGLFGAIPSTNELAHIKNHEASLILSQDEAVLGKIYLENRSNTSFEELPTYLIDALIATEDVRFLEHEGVDVISLLRVLVKTILLGNSHAGGGSTISQQLIKNVYGRPPHPFLSTPINKIKEMFAAQRLEEVYNKEEILTLYLNTVSFGENIYGIENAAQRYFSKHTKALEIEEACVLIGMLKANTYYNPRIYPEHALNRRNTVLSQLSKLGDLSAEQLDSLQDLPLVIHYKGTNDIEALAPYFVRQVKQKSRKIIQDYNANNDIEYNLNTDGLIVTTTLNLEAQQAAQQSYYKHINYLQKEIDKQIKNTNFWGKNTDFLTSRTPTTSSEENRAFIYPTNHNQDTVITSSLVDSVKYALSRVQGSLYSIDIATGKVLSYIGGRNFSYYPYDRTQSKRQVGSIFKPIVYYTALENGITPCTFYANEKRVYPEYEDWAPSNSDGKYEGYYSMMGALTNSVNTISSQLAVEAGIDNCIKNARKIGIVSDLPAVPSLALGTASLSLQEILSAYLPFSEHGKKTTPYIIESIIAKDGTVLYEHETVEPIQVLNPKYSDQMKRMLVSVVDSGTARRLRYSYNLPFDIAGKTGTTQNNTDGWFIGFSSGILTGVWVGFDQPTIHFNSTKIGQGANTALPIWANYYSSLRQIEQFKSSFTAFEYLPKSGVLEMDCELMRANKPTLFDALFKKKKFKKTNTQKKKKKKFSLFKKKERI